MNSPGGYVYVLFGEDAFGRDEAVKTLKDRMRSLPAGEHNMTELSADTSIAELRKATDVVPFLAERRMVIARGRSAIREYPRVVDVAGWIRNRARLVGVGLDEGAVRELASLGGTDLRRLDSELHKLADYTAGATVTRLDVRQLVVGRDVAI